MRTENVKNWEQKEKTSQVSEIDDDFIERMVEKTVVPGPAKEKLSAEEEQTEASSH